MNNSGPVPQHGPIQQVESVGDGDPIALVQTLVRINSASPSISLIPGPGETEIARFVKAWLEHRGIETHWTENTPGRPSVVGIVRGTGGGKSLMLNGHLDTVTLESYDGDGLTGHISDGKLFGRGSADMKGGLAAAMIAMERATKMPLRGNVILTAVADEEGESIGTEDVIAAGWRADAAIVNEPTDLEILHVHKGFALIDVNIYGVASHGSRPDLGVDAICNAGYFLVELDAHAQDLRKSQGHPLIGPGSIHASIIKGGEETASYPALCKITIERRTIAGETAANITAQIQELLEKVAQKVPNFKFDMKVTFERPPFELDAGHTFMGLVRDVVKDSIGSEPTLAGAPYWTDAALLSSVGIPALIWGPIGHGLHGKEEWVDVDSVVKVADALAEVARRFCS